MTSFSFLFYSGNLACKYTESIYVFAIVLTLMYFSRYVSSPVVIVVCFVCFFIRFLTNIIDLDEGHLGVNNWYSGIDQLTLTNVIYD